MLLPNRKFQSVFGCIYRIKQGELNTLFYIMICSIFCVFRSEIAYGIELTSISLAFQYLALFFNCQLTSVFLYTILSLPSFSVLYRCIVCQFCFPAYYFIAIIFQYYIFTQFASSSNLIALLFHLMSLSCHNKTTILLVFF